MTGPTGRWWRDPSATIAVALVWLAMVAWRPDTTFHLAPALVTASWAVTARWHAGAALRRGHGAACVTGGALVALIAATVLAAAGRLSGPDLLGGSALIETLLAVAASAPFTRWAVSRARGCRASPPTQPPVT